MPREWHSVANPVMPVGHDVHRTRGAAFLADEAPGDCRPRQILGQGVQPDIDHASIALTARTLDVTGYVAVRDPFRRASWRVFTGSKARKRPERGWILSVAESADEPDRYGDESSANL